MKFKLIPLTAAAILSLATATMAQTKIVCTEKELKSQDSEDPIIIKSCTMGNYKSISKGEADYKGRYSYSFELFKYVNNKYVSIKNTELFNEKKADLLSIINQRMKKDFDEYLKDPENKDCLEGITSPNISFEDLGITFNDSGINFNISFGLSSNCMAVDGTTITLKSEEVKPYLNK